MRRQYVAIAVVAALPLAASPALAEERNEFWPELDAYIKLGDRTRVFLGLAGTYAEKTPSASGNFHYEDAQIGVHLDVTLAPLLRPDLRQGDWQRNRYFWMRIGYRYGRTLGDADDSDSRFRERRGIFELTGRTAPLAGELELVARLRWDARDVNGAYSNRYRLRLTVERPFEWSGRTVVPFASAETFYDTRFDTWNRQRYQLGAEFELNKSWRLEPALYRQNDSRSEPARVSAFGLALKYFH